MTPEEFKDRLVALTAIGWEHALNLLDRKGIPYDLTRRGGCRWQLQFDGGTPAGALFLSSTDGPQYWIDPIALTEALKAADE